MNMSKEIIKKDDRRTIRSKRDLANALFELLQGKNLEEITVQEITDKALISKTTFYNNFKDKSELLIFLLRRSADALLDEVEERLKVESDSSKEKILYDLIHLVVNFLIKASYQFRKIIENDTNRILYWSLTTIIEDVFITLFKNKKHKFISDELDSDIAINYFSGAFANLIYKKVGSDEKVDTTHLVNEIYKLLCSSLLISCGNNEEPETPIEPPITDGGDTGGNEKPDGGGEETPKEDYTVKTSCSAGNFEEDSYLFSTINPGEEYFDFNDPVLSIAINQHDWQHVTGLNENDVKILSENDKVLPVEAVSYKTSNGDVSDNFIRAIELTIDRTKVKAGTTKLKVHFEPSNGVNTATDLDLCVPIEVKEYGSFGPKIEKAKVNLDLTGSDEKFIKKGIDFIIWDEEYEYGSTSSVAQRFRVTEVKSVVEEISLPIGSTISLGAQYKDENNKYVTEYLTIDSDSSFEKDGKYFTFSSKPTKDLTIRLP